MSAHELASKPTVAFPVRPGSMGSSHASTRPGNSLPLYTMVGPHPARSGLATGRAVSGSIFTAALILNSTKLISDLRSIQLDQKLTFLPVFSSDGVTPLRLERISEWVTELSTAMVEANQSREPFQLRDLRRMLETLLASLGVSRDVRGQVQSHRLGGVQQRHYDRHEYWGEKRATLALLSAHLVQLRACAKSRESRSQGAAGNSGCFSLDPLGRSDRKEGRGGGAVGFWGSRVEENARTLLMNRIASRYTVGHGPVSPVSAFVGSCRNRKGGV